MLEYCTLCLFCIVVMTITLYDEDIDNLPTLTKASVLIFTIPLIPILLLIFIAIKWTRND